MEERLFHITEIVIQILGLGLLVFKGGRYIGEASGMFKTLFKQQDEIKEIQKIHQVEDDRNHETIMATLTRIQVAAAASGKK